MQESNPGLIRRRDRNYRYQLSAANFLHYNAQVSTQARGSLRRGRFPNSCRRLELFARNGAKMRKMPNYINELSFEALQTMANKVGIALWRLQEGGRCCQGEQG